MTTQPSVSTAFAQNVPSTSSRERVMGQVFQAMTKMGPIIMQDGVVYITTEYCDPLSVLGACYLLSEEADRYWPRESPRQRVSDLKRHGMQHPLTGDAMGAYAIDLRGPHDALALTLTDRFYQMNNFYPSRACFVKSVVEEVARLEDQGLRLQDMGHKITDPMRQMVWKQLLATPTDIGVDFEIPSLADLQVLPKEEQQGPSKAAAAGECDISL